MSICVPFHIWDFHVKSQLLFFKIWDSLFFSELASFTSFAYVSAVAPQARIQHAEAQPLWTKHIHARERIVT